LPLSGLRVVDLTRILAEPFCSMILGDMGPANARDPPIGDLIAGVNAALGDQTSAPNGGVV
jgi:hypothetical protein